MKLTGASALLFGASGPLTGIAHERMHPHAPVSDPLGLGRFEDHFSLRITPIRLEIAPGRILETVGYNGISPGPLLRMRAGVPTALDIYNETTFPEFVHLHGQHVPAEVDGAMQEGSPAVPPGGRRRFIFQPGPSGIHWYHSHAHLKRDRTRGLYTAQQGIVLVEPVQDLGRYDREVFLITHGFLRQTEGGKVEALFSINGKALGHGDPIRVQEGERVLLRLVNGNAEDEIYLALPGHRFEVVALDGNAVPTPAAVDVLRLGSGERVDAIVEMNTPGVWILGDTREVGRDAGVGVVVEYANRSGPPRWSPPSGRAWDYTLFGARGPVQTPDETIEMVFDTGEDDGKEVWRINGKPSWKQDTYKLRQGGRYRLIFRDRSDQLHPLHLHRHHFELTRVEGKPTAGIIKDTVCIQPNGHVEVDFIASQPGLSLFHCHMQKHMDNGFMSLFECA